MPSSWTDLRIPPPETCVLRPALERQAAAQPGKVFVRFADGTEWTYAQTLQEVRRTAAGLQTLGVRQYENVQVWLPNGPDALRVWFAINYLGAVYVPLNVSYRGGILEHAIRLAGARLVVAHAALVERLAGVDRSRLADLVVLGGEAPPVPGLVAHRAAALAPTAFELAPLAHPIRPWDLQSVIYTSGTTGPSKGVMSSYLHLHSGSRAAALVTADDRQLISGPLFHMSGTSGVFAMLTLGGSVALVDAFKTSAFWRMVDEHRATYTVLLGGMATLLAKDPPSPGDRGHSLRRVLMVPLLEDAHAFSERFGVEVYTTFNMTETSWPIVSGRNPAPLGTCGTVRPGVEARVVDPNDCEVAPGGIGELILRSDRPWAMMSGYLADAEATARAWRNGWFHTGDAFRRDAEGNFFFVDRMKDAIRRRGENISSFEVEAELGTHPAVRECAVVAVPSPLGEDEVLAAVVAQPGERIDPRQLIEYLLPRMAHFMVPRYLRVLDALPKTPTEKVRKHLLREAGVTADTWDREAAGIVIRRERL
jgi:crotonobetaine/carnitine-CoA ligase